MTQLMDDDPQPLRSTQLLPVETILKLLPATFEGWPFCQPSRPPTSKSISRVERRLGVPIPNLLREVARSNSSYGYWFNSIGEDFRSPNHILKVNADLRARGVPDQFVVFAQGFDGECDAWDRDDPGPDGELPIVSFLFDDEGGELTHLTRRFRTFHEFMDALCRHGAPQCPLRELRNDAHQILREAGLPPTPDGRRPG